MTLEQYTPDAICQSMGMTSFIEPDWTPVTLRLLIKPSFHPEVCLTLTGTHESIRLSAVALSEMLWLKTAPCEMAAWREKIEVSASVFDEIVAHFQTAFSAYKLQGRMMFLDGMPVEACLLTEAGIERFETQPYHLEISAFVSVWIQRSWDLCQVPGVRNALADCGQYVGLKLPKAPAPTVPELTRIAVLGTNAAKEEFFAS